MADPQETSSIPSPEWQNLYMATALETDPTKMEERIQAVESAIKGRLNEFSLDHGGTPEENQAIEDALKALKVLRKETVAWIKPNQL